MSQFTNTLKYGALALTMATLLFNPTHTQAQNADISLETLRLENDEFKRNRINAKYTLPRDISAYSFADLYDSGTYYSKTFLSKDLGTLELRAEGTISGWEGNYIDTGIGKRISADKGYVSLKLNPIKYQNSFKQVTTAGISGKLDTSKLIPGTSIDGFINLELGEKFSLNTPKISWGEIYIRKKLITGLELGVNADINSNGIYTGVHMRIMP